MRKRLLSILLCLVMVLGLLSTAAFATGERAAGKAIRLGTGGLGANQKVYFGNYEKDPIKWEVTKVNEGNLALVSSYVLFKNCFHSDAKCSTLTYATSDIYTKTLPEFSQKSFSVVESQQISNLSLPNTNLGVATNKQGDEVAYWVSKEPEKKWLYWEAYHCYKALHGIVVDTKAAVIDEKGVRPAFNLNLNSVLFTSAAEGGKADAAVDGNLTAVETNETNEWKLTLLDSSRTFNDASASKGTELTKEYGYSDWTVNINYSGATTGENEYVSGMLVDSSDNVLYYGHIAQNSESGMVDVTIPAGLSAGTYTLKVFSEQCNGDYKTDYASAFKDVTLTVTKAPPTLTLSANSGTVYSNAGTTSFTYTYDGDGAVSAASSDTSVATVSVDAVSKTVTATILKAGTATITVSADEGANYAAAAAQTYELTVKQYVAPSYNDSDPTYAITVNKVDHGTVTASRRYAERGERVTLTVEPDKGWTLETLTVADRNGKEIDLTIVKVGEKYTFQMPSGKVTVEATFMEDNTMLNYFVDVSAGDYYYDAVLWAAVNGITSGVDALHFAPDAPCTRGQIVTFLWRAAGSPEPQTMSGFADVPADSYCAKAVAWAVERGITSGTGNGRFSPDEACTRAQAVTFLYRAAGSPAVSGYAEFDDVMTDAYYARAVAWATEQGVTEGVGSHRFAPDNTCTRGQIVTFLWRSQAD
jgi:hypothetical protein